MGHICVEAIAWCPSFTQVFPLFCRLHVCMYNACTLKRTMNGLASSPSKSCTRAQGTQGQVKSTKYSSNIRGSQAHHPHHQANTRHWHKLLLIKGSVKFHEYPSIDFRFKCQQQLDGNHHDTNGGWSTTTRQIDGQWRRIHSKCFKMLWKEEWWVIASAP